MKDETRFTVKVKKRLDELDHCWYWKTSEFARIGIPDIVGVKHGHFFAWEIKTETGTATRLQELVLSSISSAGGTGEVVRPSTLDDALARLLKRTEYC